MKNILLIAMVGVMAFSSAAQASGPGTTAAGVLNIPVGARAVAMGEAFTAVADDVSSLYWNPAGIALLNQSQASFMYNQAYKDMAYNNASLGLSLENGGIGGSLSYLSFGKIEGYDDSGNATGNVDAYSGVGTLGAGWLLDAFTVGMNAKIVRGSLADVTATGAAFDFGGTYIHPYELMGGSTLRLGATLRNLGTGMKYIQHNDPFATEYRVGAALLQLFSEKLTLSADYGRARGDKGALYAGSEYWLMPILALRAGYAGNDTESSGLRAGVGLKLRDLSFDYAYASYGDLGLTHRYELTYRFGELRPRLTPEERRMYRQAKLAIQREQYGQALLLLDSLMKLVPKYRPFNKHYKVALMGVEGQERFDKNQKTFTTLAPRNQTAPSTLPDLDDLEQLLSTSDEVIAKNSELNKNRGGVK